LDSAILSALEDDPFASARQLSRPTHLHSKTVYRRLTQPLGFIVHHLRWVPRTPQRNRKIERFRQILETTTKHSHDETTIANFIHHYIFAWKHSSLEITPQTACDGISWLQEN
jgi:hypothetical protein